MEKHIGKFYKVVFGFNEADYISIKGEELPKAIALFMEKTGRANFENGAIRGQDIMRIVPDWHKAKGWNQGWKMTADDFEDIKPLEESYRIAYERAKEIAEFAIKENRPDLLSKPASEANKEVPKFEKVVDTKFLADKFKI